MILWSEWVSGTGFRITRAGAACCAMNCGVAGEKPLLRRVCVVRIESVCLPHQDYYQDMWYHPAVEINPSIALPWTPHGFGCVRVWTHQRQLYLPHSAALVPFLGTMQVLLMSMVSSSLKLVQKENTILKIIGMSNGVPIQAVIMQMFFFILCSWLSAE